MYVCVLDMDYTLGYFDGNTFNVRPNVEFLIDFLRVTQADIVLWSLGRDDYVEQVIASTLHGILTHAKIVFGRTEGHHSVRKYGYQKCSEHIRTMYVSDILLIGVDDKAAENMDDRYDLRIHVKPYKTTDLKDVELIKVVKTLVSFYLEHGE